MSQLVLGVVVTKEQHNMDKPIPISTIGFKLQVLAKQAPYGVWIKDTPEGRIHMYYDESGKFYENTAEIEALQLELRELNKNI